MDMVFSLNHSLELGRDRHNSCGVALGDIKSCHDAIPWGFTLQGFNLYVICNFAVYSRTYIHVLIIFQLCTYGYISILYFYIETRLQEDKGQRTAENPPHKGFRKRIPGPLHDGRVCPLAPLCCSHWRLAFLAECPSAFHQPGVLGDPHG